MAPEYERCAKVLNRLHGPPNTRRVNDAALRAIMEQVRGDPVDVLLIAPTGSGKTDSIEHNGDSNEHNGENERDTDGIDPSVNGATPGDTQQQKVVRVVAPLQRSVMLQARRTKTAEGSFRTPSCRHNGWQAAVMAAFTDPVRHLRPRWAAQIHMHCLVLIVRKPGH